MRSVGMDHYYLLSSYTRQRHDSESWHSNENKEIEYDARQIYVVLHKERLSNFK